MPHPLFNMGSRRHYEATYCDEFKWKSSLRINPDKDAPRTDKPTGVKYLNPTFGENVKPRPERRHVDGGRETVDTWEDLPVGKQTYITHNRKTQAEVSVGSQMGNKKRVQTMYEYRNGLPMASLGDKNYKAPEYMPGFFRDGGLISGST